MTACSDVLEQLIRWTREETIDRTPVMLANNVVENDPNISNRLSKLTFFNDLRKRVR
jgi:hypothetical protein